MAFEDLIPLTGSEKKAPSASLALGAAGGQETASVTVLLRRRAHLAVAHGVPTSLDRMAFREQHGANQDDIALVESFAHQYSLAVADTSVSKRRVILTGTVDAVSQAFGVNLMCYRDKKTGRVFRGRTGEISIPQELQSSVVAVLGLDTRPVAVPHFRATTAARRAATFTPPQVAALYNFPTGLTGAGQTIGIIELGGGYTSADLDAYFQSLGLNTPNITAVSVDGGQNTPGGTADGEVLLDIEVAGSIAPGANIVVYFAPNTDQGFINSITDAVHDATRKPSVISISWGGPEDSWTQQSRTALDAALQDAAALGVTVTVAAGDNGSSDGVTDGALHADFPASSSYALACGGTTLAASGGAISSEVVWNETAQNEGATGGGVSIFFPLPSYQASAGVPPQAQTGFVGRGVPDVAGDADPVTGYQVLVDGQNTVVGGTSAVAPLWAALVALINQQLGRNVGFLNPTLYALGENVFQDISCGNNDDSGLGAYSAAIGWDACTGLGSPNGAALLSALSSSTSANAGS